jgi:hypothetical protein
MEYPSHAKDTSKFFKQRKFSLLEAGIFLFLEMMLRELDLKGQSIFTGKIKQLIQMNMCSFKEITITEFIWIILFNYKHWGIWPHLFN